ncbi:MAG: outer membrane protein transport protein [Deltaproteobacteria bacterium]|nr:outer membrane protein transport protein [Deltaproteobacteria bacterium]
MRRFVVVTSVVASGLLSAPGAHAAAYYVGEIGTKSLARGGANIVNPGDPSAVWLNPAAITLSTGVQLQLDLNLVWMASDFIRDCGGVDNGCAPNGDDVDRTYLNQQGAPDPKRVYSVKGNSRVLGARASDGTEVDVAEPGKLGNQGRGSRFDGTTDKVSNIAAVQPIPRIMATINSDSFGIDGIAAGVYVFAPNAGDYQFDPEGPSRYTLIDRNLLEVYYGFTLAYRFQNWIAVGASLQGVTNGLDQTLRLTADKAGNEDIDYDVQVRITGGANFVPSGNFGVWSNPLKGLGFGDLEIAGSVQLPRVVKATGPIFFDPETDVGPKLKAEFFDSGLAELNAEGATATAEFVLPPFYRVGLKYGNDNVFGDIEKTFGFDVEADFVYEAWSTYDHVFLTTKDLTFAIGGGEPEELPPIVQPKDWVDAWSIRAGGSLAFYDRMIEVHGGGFYETSAIPNSTHSIELVDGDKLGLGTGVSAKMFGARLDVGYSHIFVFERKIGDESIVFNGNVVVPPPVGAESETRTRVAMGTYNAGYDMLNIGLTVAFDDMLNFGVHTPKVAPSADVMPKVDALPEPTPAEPVVPDAPPTEPVAPVEPAVEPAPAVEPPADPVAPPTTTT